MRIKVGEVLKIIDEAVRYSEKIPDINIRFRRKEDVDVYYTIIPGFAYAHIYYDLLSNELVYEILEPELSNFEYKIINKIKEFITDRIYRYPEKYIGKDPKVAILENLVEFLNKSKINLEKSEIIKIYYYLWRDMIGYGKIEPLMHDHFIEDINVDGYGIPAYIYHNKFGSLVTNIVFEKEELDRFIVRLAQKAGRTISYAEPLLDAILPDGSRVNATYSSDVTTRGPTFTIRKFRRAVLTITDLIANGTLNIDIAAYLWEAVERKANIIIGGATASGKTTLLNMISMFIPPQAKVITIEDTRELRLYHQNWIPAITRRGFYAGGRSFGEITMYDLLSESFRQNPDYLIVGEIRGQEAYVMFQGMASGHSTMSTIHTDNWISLVKRLTSPPLNVPRELVGLIDVAVFMIKAPYIHPSARRVREIVEVGSMKERGLDHEVVIRWNSSTDDFEIGRIGKYLEKELLYKTGIKKPFVEGVEEKKEILNYIVERKIKDPKMIYDIIKLYYLDREGLLEIINGRY